MKIVILLSILLCAGTAIAAPPTVSRSTIAKYDAEKRAQLITWIEQLRGLANEADKKAQAAQTALTASHEELKSAIDNLEVLKGDIARLTEWGNTQQQLYQSEYDAHQKEKVAHAKDLHKYHHLKFWASAIVGSLAGVFALLMILRWGGLALNSVPGMAIAFGGPVVVAGIVFGAIQVMF